MINLGKLKVVEEKDCWKVKFCHLGLAFFEIRGQRAPIT